MRENFYKMVQLRVWLAAGLIFLLASTQVRGAWQAPAVAQELKVTTGFAGKDSIAQDEPFELTLNRPLSTGDGRLAILVGTTDLTDLITLEGMRLRFVPQALMLQPGETEVVVYLIGADEEWREGAVSFAHCGSTNIATRYAAGGHCST
jgi:hypothetical protein